MTDVWIVMEISMRVSARMGNGMNGASMVIQTKKCIQETLEKGKSMASVSFKIRKVINTARELKCGKQGDWGSFVEFSGDRFTGDCKDCERHGWGFYRSNNGNKLTGEYRGSLRHGWGCFADNNGNKYIGEYEADKRVERWKKPWMELLSILWWREIHG